MGNNKDSLGDRMKEFYENRSRYYLTRRMPVAIRIDGKAFHSFTRGMKKPFDEILVKSMQETMKYLCANIQGCVLGYTQSDEITLVLTDYATIMTDAWFDNNLQKMCSVAASMATMSFNKTFATLVEERIRDLNMPLNSDSEEAKYLDKMRSKTFNAMFDARVFTIPQEEVANMLIWRQQDAVRNSIQSVGQAYFSHKELDHKTCNDIQDMLMLQKHVNWNDYPTTLKQGSCCVRKSVLCDEPALLDPNFEVRVPTYRNQWVIDNEIPVFTQDRDYIERLI